MENWGISARAGGFGSMARVFVSSLQIVGTTQGESRKHQEPE